MLKFRVENLDDVEEAFRSLYKETQVGEKKFFVLQVEGAVASERATDLQAKLNTFRKNNTKLAERLKVFAEHANIEIEDDLPIEDLSELLKEKAAEIRAELEKTGKGGSKEDIEKLVLARVEAVKTQHEAAIRKLQADQKKLAEERDGYFKSLEKLSIENEVLSAAGKRGLKPTAHFDIVNRARQVFVFSEGKVRALAEDGETPRYGADGLTELTISEWIDLQATKDASHLFESNSGGGAPGGSGGAGRNGHHSGPNPFKKESFNMTRQMELMRRDPATAKRLAGEAGVNLPAFASR